MLSVFVENLVFPQDSLLWVFHPDMLSGGKRRGKWPVECFVISVLFLKREDNITAMNAVISRSNPLVFFFLSPLFSRSFRSVKSRACLKIRSRRIGERLK